MRHVLIAALSFLSVFASVQAAVPSEQAARLGKDLTPIGAESAANAEGTIPAWTGGLPYAAEQWPKGYTRNGFMVDPFPQDRPLFTITAANLPQHRDKLSEGHKAMFARHKNYTMPVYSSRRSVSFPEPVLEATVANATRAELRGTDDLRGAKLGFAFPIPANGAEAMWNHKTRYAGASLRRSNNTAVVAPDGRFKLSKLIEDIFLRYGNLKVTYREEENLFAYFRQYIQSPPKGAGQVTLVHETLNQVREPRKTWIYNPGVRRVRRAPTAGYDQPANAADGLRTTDQAFLFNGALDRYNWNLLGKRELYIPYNSYRVNKRGLKYEEVIKPGHLNQDLLRYELHRAWVVEATVRRGTTHIYAKRRFYLDEDSWNVVLVDCYDRRGELWRFQEGHLLFHYQLVAAGAAPEVTYDLQSGRYVVDVLTTQDLAYQETALSEEDFTTTTIQRWQGQ